MRTLRFSILIGLCTLGLVLVGCDDEQPLGGTSEQGSKTTFTVEIANVSSAGPIRQSDVFNTAVRQTDPGPLKPGQAYETTISAGPNVLPGTGVKLSFATMFIQSNDLFYAFGPGGLDLYDENGTPDTDRDNTPIGQNGPVDVTDQVRLWDAGTEVNQEPGTGPDQAPRQDSADTGTEEGGTIRPIQAVNDGFSYPDVEDVIKVTVEYVGNTEFIFRIENVSDETGAQANGQPIPLSPGTFAVHFDQTPQGDEVAFFNEGGEASAGLERIAEDGSPGAHAEAIAGLTGLNVPLSPGAYAVHSDDVQLFDPDGSLPFDDDSGNFTIGEGIERIAEDGEAGPLSSALSDFLPDAKRGTFGSGPIAPGSSVSFQVTATPGEHLSFVTMYIQSNDLFLSPPANGVALFDPATGEPVSGPQTVRLYDAGTEGDQPPGAGFDQAPRQLGGDTGPEGEGEIALVGGSNDGFSYPSAGDVIEVTVTPQ